MLLLCTFPFSALNPLPFSIICALSKSPVHKEAGKTVCMVTYTFNPFSTHQFPLCGSQFLCAMNSLHEFPKTILKHFFQYRWSVSCRICTFASLFENYLQADSVLLWPFSSLNVSGLYSLLASIAPNEKPTVRKLSIPPSSYRPEVGASSKTSPSSSVQCSSDTLVGVRYDSSWDSHVGCAFFLLWNFHLLFLCALPMTSFD